MFVHFIVRKAVVISVDLERASGKRVVSVRDTTKIIVFEHIILVDHTMVFLALRKHVRH